MTALCEGKHLWPCVSPLPRPADAGRPAPRPWALEVLDEADRAGGGRATIINTITTTIIIVIGMIMSISIIVIMDA